MLTYKQRQQLIDIADNTNRMAIPNNDEVAFVTLMRICRDYATPGVRPMMDGESRERWLIERLNKYKIRFFDKI
jgi:hypothetical protein